MLSFWKRLRIALIPGKSKRNRYIIKHGIFASIGENFMFLPRLLPQDPEYIRFGNNCRVSSNVLFINHDGINRIFEYMPGGRKLKMHYGCIDVRDNVWISANAVITPNVRIGPNAVVLPGSVVTEDVPENSVVQGNPAKKIGSFENLYKARLMQDMVSGSGKATPELAWQRFEKSRRD